MTRQQDTILAAQDYYAARMRSGTGLLPSQHREAVCAEVEELADAQTHDELCDEFGDVLLNVLVLGASMGFLDPLSLAQASLDKVRRRVSCVEGRIEIAPNSPGYRDVFNRLWDECKRDERRTKGRG